VSAPSLMGAALLTLFCLTAPAQSDMYAVDPNSHTVPEKELWQLAARSSQVVLLGRVMAPMASPDTLHQIGDMVIYALRVRIEPIEYLKGGLEGDIIDARYRFGGLSHRNPATVTLLAGVDTLGAIFFLRQEEHEWWLASIQPAYPGHGRPSDSSKLEREMYEGFVTVSQRKWIETLDQVRAWIQETPLDSLKTRR